MKIFKKHAIIRNKKGFFKGCGSIIPSKTLFQIKDANEFDGTILAVAIWHRKILFAKPPRFIRLKPESPLWNNFEDITGTL